MPRVKPKTKLCGKVGRSSRKMIDRKPIRPLERQRMRPWLIDLLDKSSCHQLEWHNKNDMTFKVSWKHAAGQTFDPDSDATLFELWARHTGKFYTGDPADPKRWKANFRCALHSLPDVEEDKKLGVKRGNNAYRVYRFLNEKRVKRSGKSKDKDEKSSDNETDDEDYIAVRNIGANSRPRKMETDHLDSEGSESYSPSYESNHSDWEFHDDAMEHEDEKSPLPKFEELYKPFAKEVPTSQVPPLEPMTALKIEAEDLSYEDSINQTRPEDCITIHIEYDNVDNVDNDCDTFMGMWSSVVDPDLDVQEEVVISDGTGGPNVIVMKESENSFAYTHEFTCIEDL